MCYNISIEDNKTKTCVTAKKTCTRYIKKMEVNKMTNTKIICTQIYQQFDYNTNKYLTIDKVVKTITEEMYNNMTSKDTINYFRCLGGTEKPTRKGGRVTKLISTSPSGERRTVRTFEFSE